MGRCWLSSATTSSTCLYVRPGNSTLYRKSSRSSVSQSSSCSTIPLIFDVSIFLLSFSARSNHSRHKSAPISASHFFLLAMVACLPSGGTKTRLAIWIYTSLTAAPRQENQYQAATRTHAFLHLHLFRFLYLPQFSQPLLQNQLLIGLNLGEHHSHP